MNLKNIAWNLFENTGNVETYLAMKELESQEKEELKKMLAESLELLTDKEKKVILLYYYEELTLKEISEVLEVSESRVSQLHTRALQKMREKLGDYLGIVTNSR